MSAGHDGATSERRRRDRQLRAWHLHVRTTVAMELATALHHSAQRPKSRVVEGPSEEEVHEKYAALRRQKRHPPGTRSGAPLDPEPQVAAATVGYVAAGAPLLVVAPLAGGDVVDATTVSYLLRENLRRTKEEEEKERTRVEEVKAAEKHEAKMPKLGEKIRHDVPLTEAEWAALYQWQGISPKPSSSSSGKRRKRKKQKLPRSSSLSSCSRARRRQWQRHAHCAGFLGDVSPRAVFPSVVVRPAMLGIMAFVNQKDSTTLCRFWQWHVQGWFYWVRCTLRYVPFWRRQAQDAPHLGRYGPDYGPGC